MKHVIFISNDQIVDVWENRQNVKLEEQLLNADGEVILGFPGEILIIDASIDYKNKTIDELRELANQEQDSSEQLQEKINDLEQKIAQLEAAIQQLLNQENGGG